jgi:hypothetical protein
VSDRPALHRVARRLSEGKHHGQDKDKDRPMQQLLQDATRLLEGPAMILGHNATHVFGLDSSQLTTTWGAMTSDIIYIPERHRIGFIGLSTAFDGDILDAAITTPHIVVLLADGNNSDYLTLPGNYLGRSDRADTAKWGLMNDGLANGAAWMHPVKITQHKDIVTEWWSQLSCPSGIDPVPST